MIISRGRGADCYHEEWCPYAKKIGKKYRRTLNKEEARRRGYQECTWCGGMHGIYLELKRNPEQRGKFGKNLHYYYDRKDHALCVRSEIGFWKILKNRAQDIYALYHLNSRDFSRSVGDKFLARRFFHRQSDVKVTDNISFILRYIYDHDKAKLMMWNDDIRKLPKSTKQQKRYYKHVKKMKIKKEINRVNDIFAQLKREENQKNG